MSTLSILFAILSAFAALLLNINATHPSFVRPEPVGVYDDPSRLACNRTTSHCVYLKHAFAYGDKDQKPVRCSKRNKLGYGIGTCEFDDNTTTTIECNYDPLITFDVIFGNNFSSWILHGYAMAIWDSEKGSTDYLTGSPNTTQPGDDLYIGCPGSKTPPTQVT